MEEKPELELLVLNTPESILRVLEGCYCFAPDQSLGIASEVYQPLKDYIEHLERRIEALEKDDRS